MDMWICVNETGPVNSWQGQARGQTAFNQLAMPATEHLKRLKMELKKEKMKRQMRNQMELTAKEKWHRPTGVRTGPRNKPTQKEREEHEAPHVTFRDWCTHCMMGRGRTHHHITKQKSEVQSRRPTIVTDWYLIKMNSAVNTQTRSQETVKCIAVKED